MIIGLGGAPGAGKTTLTKELMKTFGEHQLIKCRSVRLQWHPASNVCILGVYDDAKVFSGTDAMPMSIQPKVMEFVKIMPLLFNNKTNLFFEGDRLFNGKFFDWLITQKNEFALFILQAPEQVLEQRYKDRGSEQNPAWLKGRHTKYAKLVNKYSFINKLNNATFQDQKCNIELLQSFLQ